MAQETTMPFEYFRDGWQTRMRIDMKVRSEERRVGKESNSRWVQYKYEKNGHKV
ncbi:MAG: hypothetical protein HKUEN02_05740 [Anaerolineaceae bacterium]|nr:MAG: hypothetical protein HKUEN02_05740 [Anaerolineaceae bacterium]